MKQKLQALYLQQKESLSIHLAKHSISEDEYNKQVEEIEAKEKDLKNGIINQQDVDKWLNED